MKGYLSHESFWTDVRMWFNMIKWGVVVCFVFQAIFIMTGINIAFKELKAIPLSTSNHIPGSAIIKYYLLPGEVIRTVKVEDSIKHLFGGREFIRTYDYKRILNRRANNAFNIIGTRIKERVQKSLLAYLLIPVYILFFSVKSLGENKDEHIRGIEVLSLRKFNKRLRKGAKKEKSPIPHLTIGKSVFPRKMETAHMLIMGAAGSGKSVLLNQLLKQINDRKSEENPERCVIYDMKGEFIEKHYEADKDYIFSPFDTRSIRWSFFNEIKNIPDFDVISQSLYIAPDPKNEYWYNCAKDVFRTGLIYLDRQNLRTNKDIWNFFSMSLEGIKNAFNELPLEERGAIKHIDKADSTASANIISILQERIQFFRYLKDMDGEFCFKDFIRNNSTRNLYLLNIDAYKNIFKPLMSLIIDTMIREILSLPDDLKRRIFFIIDELGSLYKLESVLDLVTIGRAKGGPLICANQDLGRLEDTYGRANIKTFFNNFNSLITFRINEPESAEFLSKAIGEQQIKKSMENKQLSPNDFGDRKGYNQQEKMERIVIPSELQSFKDFEAILKISNYGLSKTKIPRVFYPKKNQHFIMKDFTIPHIIKNELKMDRLIFEENNPTQEKDVSKEINNDLWI